MGVLRLLLAIYVLLQHSGVSGIPQPMDANVAVPCFFAISGFYIQLIISEKFAKQGESWKWQFYKSRAARIFPAYYLILALYVAVPSSALVHDWHYNRVALIALNGSIVAAGPMCIVSMFSPVLGWKVHFADYIVPTAWSLSPELIFYLLAPFVFLKSSRFILLVALGLVASTTALRALQLENLAAWTALFPEWPNQVLQYFTFEMSLFVAGALAFRIYVKMSRRWPWPESKKGDSGIRLFMRQPMINRVVYTTSGVICVLSLWYLCGGGSGHTPSHVGPIPLPASEWLEIVTLITTIPFIFYFSRYCRWDRNLGELSYPIYLSHMLIIRIVGSYSVLTPQVVYWVILPITLLLSVLIWTFIEQPLSSWRHSQFGGKRYSAHAQDTSGVPFLG